MIPIGRSGGRSGALDLTFRESLRHFTLFLVEYSALHGVHESFSLTTVPLPGGSEDEDVYQLKKEQERVL